MPFYDEGCIIPMSDVMMSAYCCFENKYVIAPLKSLVSNMGFDGGEINMKKGDPYGCNNNLDTNDNFEFVIREPLEMDHHNMYITNKYLLKASKKRYIKSCMIYFIYLILQKIKGN